MCPVPVLTLYELGYVTTGKWSIYLISFVAVMSNIGGVVLFFIIMGDLAAQMVLKVFFPEGNIMTTKSFWVVIFATFLLPICLKKVINEMKWISYTLFAAVIVFIFFFAFELAKDGPYNSQDTKALPTPTNLGRIQALSVFLFSYNFSTFEFPMYSSLGPERNEKKMMNAISLAMFLTLSIYLTTGFLALKVFGPNISNNILLNFNKIDGFLPMLSQLIFLILIICHVPYMFLVGKEAICIVGDEIINKTMSKSLQKITEERQSDKDAKINEALIILNMDDKVYYCLTIATYIVTVFSACSVDSLQSIFDYISAFAVSGIQFFFPAIAYINLSKNSD
jgi:amino acid permease